MPSFMRDRLCKGGIEFWKFYGQVLQEHDALHFEKPICRKYWHGKETGIVKQVVSVHLLALKVD